MEVHRKMRTEAIMNPKRQTIKTVGDIDAFLCWCAVRTGQIVPESMTNDVRDVLIQYGPPNTWSHDNTKAISKDLRTIASKYGF